MAPAQDPKVFFNRLVRTGLRDAISALVSSPTSAFRNTTAAISLRVRSAWSSPHFARILLEASLYFFRDALSLPRKSRLSQSSLLLIDFGMLLTDFLFLRRSRR